MRILDTTSLISVPAVYRVKYHKPHLDRKHHLGKDNMYHKNQYPNDIQFSLWRQIDKLKFKTIDRQESRELKIKLNSQLNLCSRDAYNTNFATNFTK